MAAAEDRVNLNQFVVNHLQWVRLFPGGARPNSSLSSSRPAGRKHRRDHRPPRTAVRQSGGPAGLDGMTWPRRLAARYR
ncbi:hypothetical protein [Nocardioides guangzhouensis]|uniref:hypothetical protein n=1 Tax=Nocardioides guangzhouensis TaxID=2497878 RepID=UPI001FE3BBBB|nr:hypothetical protein [Nocardioides guangzhouensis]